MEVSVDPVTAWLGAFLITMVGFFLLMFAAVVLYGIYETFSENKEVYAVLLVFAIVTTIVRYTVF